MYIAKLALTSVNSNSLVQGMFSNPLVNTTHPREFLGKTTAKMKSSYETQIQERVRKYINIFWKVMDFSYVHVWTTFCFKKNIARCCVW